MNSTGDAETQGAEGADPQSLGSMPTQRPTAGRFRAGALVLGRYRVSGELGQGGMGVVYRCHDEIGGIDVALKAIPPELSHNTGEMEEVRENFRLIEKLHHPHIAGVKTLERDPAAGDYYLVLECVDGINLRRYRKSRGADGRLSLEQAVPLLRQVAEALDYAHAQRILHRDIKPSNVMVGADGAVKVLDFGLASQLHTSLSRVSQVKYGTSGTGPYMAPEQWEGDVQDAATDAYALAVVAYELLAGHCPFESHEIGVLRQAVLNTPVRPISGLPHKTMRVLEQGLAKDRTARYASCTAFVDSLAGLASPKRPWGASARPTKPWRRRVDALEGRTPTKHRWRARLRPRRLLATTALLALLALGAVFGYRRWTAFQRERATQRIAREQAQRLSAETQARVRALVGEAETALRTGAFTEAEQKLGAIDALDKANPDSARLRRELEGKIGERKAREAKVDADMAWENLRKRNLDPGQGFAARQSAVEKQWRIAADAYAAARWGEAFSAYQGTARGVKDLLALENERQAALAKKAECDAARQSAATAGAQSSAATLWSAGGRASTRAAAEFEQARFSEAATAWTDAARQWQAAETFAGQAAAYAAAKTAYEQALAKAGAARLAEHGGAAWTEVERQARLGAAGAADPVAGRKAYDAARAGLDRAAAAADKAAGLADWRAARDKAAALLDRVRRLPENDRTGPALIKQGLADLKAFEQSVVYPRLGQPERAELARIARELDGLQTRFGPQPGQALTLDLGGGVRLELVWVQALNAWAGKYEVTNEEYRRFKPDHSSQEYKGHSLDGPRQPVVYVSYDDAVAFAQWLTQKARQAGQLPEGYQVRLPDGNEWMTVAQCGDGREYPWGNSWPPKSGNHADETSKRELGFNAISGYDDGYAVTCPVEKSGRNDWGLYGVGGNVWEWTSDQSGGSRVLRGASWVNCGQVSLRCSNRYSLHPTFRDGGFGFRVFVAR